MNAVKLIFFSLFILADISYSQEITITKIVDSNLFQTEDGSCVKLAGIDMPGLNNPDYLYHKTAEDAVELCKELLLDKTVRFKFIKHESDYDLVYLYKDYLFGSKLLNLIMLAKGYGKYINNVEANDTSAFISAQTQAIRNSSGIWRLAASFYSDLPEAAPVRKQDDKFRQDSLNYEMNKYPKPGAGKVIAELIIGSGSGLAFSAVAVGVTMLAYPPGKDGIKYNGLRNITFFTTFALASASVVYELSRSTSKKASYSYTLLSSVIGAGIGGSLLALADYNHVKISPELISIPLIFSALAPILYVNTIAPDKFSDTQTAEIINFIDNSITAGQIYNSTKLFDVELFRINF